MLSDRRGAELGTILTEVRHDLKHLKNELLQRGGEGIDLTALNQAIERTEDKLRVSVIRRCYNVQTVLSYRLKLSKLWCIVVMRLLPSYHLLLLLL